MPKLPRGTCQVCERSVPVRRNGDAREHRASKHKGASWKCAGSGYLVKEELAKKSHAAAR